MISGENGSGFNFPIRLFQSTGGNSGVKRINGKGTKDHGRFLIISIMKLILLLPRFVKL